MKRLSLLTLTLLCCVGVAAEDYVLVWSEEFDYVGEPDPTKWTYEQGFVRNREWQWYQPQNAYVRDGMLTIVAREEHFANPTFNPQSNYWGCKRDSVHCTSACVITNGRQSFLYGRIEVRARIPATPGTWPAIWLLGAQRNLPEAERKPWPYCGEVDIMEYYPVNGKPHIHANACWGGKEGNSVWDSQAIPVVEGQEARPDTPPPPMGTPPSLGGELRGESLWTSQFHVWRMDWDEDWIRIYIDDELLNEIDLSQTVNGRYGEDNPFHKPMYLLLNLAMGSTGGQVDMQTMPARYEIDYVRYYKKM